ncbi:MAG: phytoene desaturase family protein [Acetobacteraceae bacterium]
MPAPRVIIIGAGAGGLSAAIDLARQGVAVTVLEGAAAVGGKMHRREAGPASVDAGPTVLTMRWVFDELFSDAGATLDSCLTLHPADLLARHAWSASERLDLFADVKASADAIGALAGRAEAAGYREFVARAQRMFRTLDGPFMRAPRPTALSLAAATGLSQIWGIAPFATMWKALGQHFRDPRLQQLFGRYATYSGSSPFAAPATLMVIAHVEQCGVWLPEGGMTGLAEAMAGLARRLGAEIRLDAPVAGIVVQGGRARGVTLASGERLEADAIICNADAAALATGLLGPGATAAVPQPDPGGRSLSAVTWCLSAVTDGFPLTRHNVFFSRAYQAEFDEIFSRRRLPTEPTVYVCAQDRGGPSDVAGGAPEALLILINAPAIGDQHAFTQVEIDACATRTFRLLEHCGLTVRRQPEMTVVSTPAWFAKRFPATGGALYGQAVHGAMAAFSRPGARSKIPGLYLAGGSVHPGPGVPMAVLSGRLAASALMADRTSR